MIDVRRRLGFRHSLAFCTELKQAPPPHLPVAAPKYPQVPLPFPRQSQSYPNKKHSIVYYFALIDNVAAIKEPFSNVTWSHRLIDSIPKQPKRCHGCGHVISEIDERSITIVTRPGLHCIVIVVVCYIIRSTRHDTVVGPVDTSVTSSVLQQEGGACLRLSSGAKPPKCLSFCSRL
jgi:hypothetical protein